jgi:high frequency lysogenization protein
MIEQRALALAGLVQALKQVRRIAETGQADTATLATAMDSVFRIDAESPVDVYGSVRELRPGLLLLRDYFASQGDDAQLPKLALAVMQLERRFMSSQDTIAAVHAGIVQAKPLAERLGGTHPEVFTALGRLYADTVSQLRPRVMVQGNPHYLGQADVVAEIRAVLLAALRSAVLWRQLGGSLWDLALRRRAILEAIEHWLD